MLKTKIDAVMVTCKSILLPEEHSNTQSLKYYNLALGKVFTNCIVLINIYFVFTEISQSCDPITPITCSFRKYPMESNLKGD